MRAIMYHYVREGRADLPYFRYLHEADFAAQLDWFAESNRFLEQKEFFAAAETGVAPDGLVLTFDDGFSDHFGYVLPELQRRGLWGIFYVPTGPQRSAKLLDVHRVHILLGRLGGAASLKVMQGAIEPHMLAGSIPKEFRDNTYEWQDNEDATLLFKRTLNYFVSYEWRERVLDRMMMDVFAGEADPFDGYYLTKSQILSLHESGMVIGSHGVNHLVFNKLPLDQQKQEINESFDDLASIIGSPVRTFCYPYGHRYTFTSETMQFLTDANAKLSFAVDPRDVTDEDLVRQPQALPRYDCNQFPHGQTSIGASRPAESAPLQAPEGNLI